MSSDTPITDLLVSEHDEAFVGATAGYNELLVHARLLERDYAKAERAIVAERIACAKLACEYCRKGYIPDYQSDPEPTYWHGSVQCRADSIWLRGSPSDALGEAIKGPA